jgi:FkbM family methyltransferase
MKIRDLHESDIDGAICAIENITALAGVPRLFEDMLAAIYSLLVTAGDTVIDVGAHRGMHTSRLLQLVGDTGVVVAVEPLAQARRQIELLATREPRLRVIPVAAGDRLGELPFFIAEQALEESGFAIRQVYTRQTSFREITVPVRTLDDIAADLPRISYIKIDVEGAEASVVRGATGVLTRDRPVLSFEHGCEGCDLLAREGTSMHRFFGDKGYRIFDVFLNRYPDDGAFRKMALSGAVFDFLAVPQEMESDFISRMSGLGSRQPTCEHAYRYPATIEAGMDFRLSFLPSFLETIEGISTPEDWGCWTNADRLVARFRDPLPTQFRLSLNGYAFETSRGKPIRIVTDGETVPSCVMKGGPSRLYQVACANQGRSRTLELIVPSPAAPAEIWPGRSTDTRRLGVALTRMFITPK